MKTACFIPIKANSERVPGKNFRVLNGRKLYEYIISHAMEACCFDAIYIDTNSPEITEYALDHGLQVIERLEALAQNTANGNDLLVYHQQLHPEYDYYFQLFATAPYLQPDSIKGCVNALVDSETYDSCFTALKNHGFYWLDTHPVNYRPGILPRSQECSRSLRKPRAYTASQKTPSSGTAAVSAGNPAYSLWTSLKPLTSTRRRTW